MELLASNCSLCQVYLGFRSPYGRGTTAMSDRPNASESRADGPRETSQLLVIGLLVACSFLPACSHPLSHQVRPGETLSVIALRYGVPYQEIAQYNALQNPDRLEVGQWLRIPPVQQTRSASAVTARARPVAFALPEPRPTLRPLLPDGGWSRGSP